jgi:cold shock CspA family protein
MLGKIKFVKEHYGYILPEDGGQDVHFWTKDC